MKSFLLLTAALAVSAVVQMPGRAEARVAVRERAITVAMTDDGFAPRRIVLTGGARYVLRIVNRSGKGHNFTQKAFFADAGIAPADRGVVGDGQISLRPGEGVTIHLRAPDARPGARYEYVSTVLGDADDEYKGELFIR